MLNLGQGKLHGPSFNPAPIIPMPLLLAFRKRCLPNRVRKIREVNTSIHKPLHNSHHPQNRGLPTPTSRMTSIAFYKVSCSGMAAPRQLPRYPQMARLRQTTGKPELSRPCLGLRRTRRKPRRRLPPHLRLASRSHTLHGPRPSRLLDAQRQCQCPRPPLYLSALRNLLLPPSARPRQQCLRTLVGRTILLTYRRISVGLQRLKS